jgi:hypothetical protein
VPHALFCSLCTVVIAAVITVRYAIRTDSVPRRKEGKAAHGPTAASSVNVRRPPACCPFGPPLPCFDPPSLRPSSSLRPSRIEDKIEEQDLGCPPSRTAIDVPSRFGIPPAPLFFPPLRIYDQQGLHSAKGRIKPAILISEVRGRFSRSTSTHVSNSGVDFPSRLFANPRPPNPLYVTFSSTRHDPHFPLLYNAGSDHLSVHDQPCSNKKFLVIRPPQRCSVKGANRFAALSRRSLLLDPWPWRNSPHAVGNWSLLHCSRFSEHTSWDMPLRRGRGF